MTCPVCGDKGLVRVNYHDGSPMDYGVCLCAAGQFLRVDANAVGRRCGAPRWMPVAAMRGIPVECVYMVEELLEAEDLATIPRAEPAKGRGSIAAAVQVRRPRL